MDFDSSAQVDFLAKLPPLPPVIAPLFTDRQMELLTYALVFVALQTGLCAARSLRGGFSGRLGTYLALPAQAAFVAAIVLCTMLVGWWTVAVFIVASVVAGMLIGRDNLAWWVQTQPAWWCLTIILAAAAWGIHLAS